MNNFEPYKSVYRQMCRIKKYEDNSEMYGIVQKISYFEYILNILKVFIICALNLFYFIFQINVSEIIIMFTF